MPLVRVEQVETWGSLWWIPMIPCTRRLTGDALRRSLRRESMCCAFSGHHYAWKIKNLAPGFDAPGRVVDFGVV